MSSILCENLEIGFKNYRIFSGLTMAIEQGEFIAIIGPNGAGKTTLLRAILGLIKPLQGSLSVCGRAAERGNPDVGYMPQMHHELETFPLSGRALLEAAVSGTEWGLPFLNKSKKHQIRDAIEFVDIVDLVDRPYQQLSGGERQRLSLARALLGNPKILLLDEPLSSLDPHQNERIIELIARLNSQLNVTLLITTHQIQPILNRIDRILCLGQGEATLIHPDEVSEETFKKLYQIPNHDRCAIE